MLMTMPLGIMLGHVELMMSQTAHLQCCILHLLHRLCSRHQLVGGSAHCLLQSELGDLLHNSGVQAIACALLNRFMRDASMRPVISTTLHVHWESIHERCQHDTSDINYTMCAGMLPSRRLPIPF